MNNELLNFGEMFIRSVRDNTLFVLDGIISGRIKSPNDKVTHQEISKMRKEEIEVLKDFAYRMVDLSLHNTLYMFETNSEWKISKADEEIENLSDLSDGLSGELYTDDGWINKFSKYPISKGL